MWPLSAYMAFALALATLMCVRGYRKRSLNASGAALAFVVGFVSCTASVRFGLTLITFFVASSKATRVGAARKRKLEDGHQEGGNRNWVQVAANGGLGTALAACYLWSTRQRGDAPEQPLDFGAAPWHTLLQAAYMCHYACCNADTWASELGVLSSGSPRLVTTCKRVPPGTNGGVSAVGTGASVAGGLLIGAVFWALGGALQGAAAATAPPCAAPHPDPGAPTRRTLRRAHRRPTGMSARLCVAQAMAAGAARRGRGLLRLHGRLAARCDAPVLRLRCTGPPDLSDDSAPSARLPGGSRGSARAHCAQRAASAACELAAASAACAGGARPQRLSHCHPPGTPAGRSARAWSSSGPRPASRASAGGTRSTTTR